MTDGAEVTRAYLFFSNGSQMGSAITFVGNKATINQNLEDGLTYFLVTDDNGASYSRNGSVAITSSFSYFVMNGLIFQTPPSTFGDSTDNPIEFIEVDDLLSNIVLNSPINNSASNTTEVLFNATAEVIGGATLVNRTLFVWFDNGTLFGTNTTTGLSGTSQTSIDTLAGLEDRDYLWNKEFCDSDGDCGFSIFNNSLSIDSAPPIIVIQTPTGLLDFGSIGGNQVLNVTINDTNLDICWFDYNGTNITIDGCVTGKKNSTNFTLESGNFNLTVYANDTSGNENSSFVNWTYRVFQNSQTFSVNTTEGSTEEFILNYTANETPTSVNFIYNGSITSADIDSSDFPIIIVSESIIIPNVDSTTNLSFFWNIVSDTSDLNTTSTNQSVGILSLDNCGSFTNVLFNYTMVNEADQLLINGTSDNVSLEVEITIFSSDKSLSILNFSTSFSGSNPNAICSSTNLFNGTNFTLDSTVKYSSDPREIEYFNIRDATLDNSSTTQNITLFDILTSESTEFQITFKNSDFVVQEGALIQVNRQYVSEGVFKTVELPITDSNGQTVVHLVKNDVVYNYIVTLDNIVIGLFNNLIAFCEDETIGQCFISLNALQGTVPAFNPDSGSGISFSPLSFNETSRDLSFTFVSNDGTVKSVLLNGTKFDQLGEINVCSISLVSSSGTLICNIAESLGNETIIITVFVDDELAFTSFFRAGNDVELGVGGYFILFFLVISLGLMFSESKSMMIGGIILGFIGGSALFLISGNIITGGSAIMWLIIMGIILIWKLQSEGQT